MQIIVRITIHLFETIHFQVKNVLGPPLRLPVGSTVGTVTSRLRMRGALSLPFQRKNLMEFFYFP